MSTTIVFTTTSLNGLESQVDPRFGRAFGFVFIDSRTGKIVKEIENRSVNASHGAGTGAAGTIAKENVQAVISGKFGPKAYSALTSLKVKMLTAPENTSIKEALEQFKSGTLTEMKVDVYE